tara:strand:+ start:161 stop:268 length:108 start_codon:yes stop_codon:yes gene_type:complete
MKYKKQKEIIISGIAGPVIKNTGIKIKNIKFILLK